MSNTSLSYVRTTQAFRGNCIHSTIIILSNRKDLGIVFSNQQSLWNNCCYLSYIYLKNTLYCWRLEQTGQKEKSRIQQKINLSNCLRSLECAWSPKINLKLILLYYTVHLIYSTAQLKIVALLCNIATFPFSHLYVSQCLWILTLLMWSKLSTNIREICNASIKCLWSVFFLFSHYIRVINELQQLPQCIVFCF